MIGNSGEQRIDSTDVIEVYEKGKTWDCKQCGHGIGTELKTRAVECASCGSVLVDEEAENREPNIQSGQTTIGDW